MGVQVGSARRPARWLGWGIVGLGTMLLIASAVDYVSGADAIPSAATAIGLVVTLAGFTLLQRSGRA